MQEDAEKTSFFRRSPDALRKQKNEVNKPNFPTGGKIVQKYKGVWSRLWWI